MSEKHARLSPSSASRWMNCPGSLAMEERSSPQKDNEYSSEGTAAHSLASKALTDGRHSCEDYVGKKMPNGWEVTEDMAEDTQIYVDEILKYAQKGDLLVEQKLSIEHLTGEPGAEGTVDASIIVEEEELLIIADLKFGRGVAVHPEENEQIMTYALAALKQFGMLCKFKKVKLVIIQPRVLNQPAEWECSVEDLNIFAKKLKEAATLAFYVAEKYKNKEVPLQYLHPSEDSCRFCRAKANCPALIKEVQDAIGADFDDLTLANDVKKFVPSQDPELLAKKMGAIEMIEEFCKAVRAEVETYLLSGVDVPGFKIVQGRKGHRKWIDKEHVEEILKGMRYKIEEIYKFKLISPTDAEKLIKKENPKRWEKIKLEITQSEGKPSVAPVSDERPALDIKPVQEQFENLT
jgi:hypothetical protein